VARARRGDLSGPVLAILVTLILLAIGAAIIAYFTLFAGGTAQPVITVTGQPVAYRVGTTNDANVSITVANVGSAPVTLLGHILFATRLEITGPPDLVQALRDGRGSEDVAPLGGVNGYTLTIPPGSTAELKFRFVDEWGDFARYRTATARLILVDTAGNTIGILEVNIRIIGGG